MSRVRCRSFDGAREKEPPQEQPGGAEAIVRNGRVPHALPVATYPLDTGSADSAKLILQVKELQGETFWHEDNCLRYRYTHNAVVNNA